MPSILHARDFSDEVSAHLAGVRAFAMARRELLHWTRSDHALAHAVGWPGRRGRRGNRTNRAPMVSN